MFEGYKKIKKKIDLVFYIIMAIFLINYGFNKYNDYRIDMVYEKINQFKEMVDNVSLYNEVYYFDATMRYEKKLTMSIYFDDYNENIDYDYENTIDVLNSYYEQSELGKLNYIDEIEFIFFEITEGKYDKNSFSATSVYLTEL